MDSDFRFVQSCDLEANVQIKICTMEGRLPRLGNFECFGGALSMIHQRILCLDYTALLENPLLQYCGQRQSKIPDFLVEAVITVEDSGNFTELHLPVATSYKCFQRRWEWNEWLRLPLKYSDLPREAVLTLSLYDCLGGQRQKLATAALPLFGKKGIYRQGQVDLQMVPIQNEAHEPSEVDNLTSMAGKHLLDVNELAKLTKKYQSGKIPPVDWLDRLTFAEIEKVSQKKKESSNILFLMVEFPQVHYERKQYSIVYFERNGDLLNATGSKSEILRVYDPEMQSENLVETKHHKLARARRTGQSEKDLKPNAPTRNRLNDILAYPTTQTLSSEDKDLIWQYRFYLSANKKALAKFVKCVDWNARTEANQALELVGFFCSD